MPVLKKFGGELCASAVSRWDLITSVSVASLGLARAGKAKDGAGLETGMIGDRDAVMKDK